LITETHLLILLSDKIFTQEVLTLFTLIPLVQAQPSIERLYVGTQDGERYGRKVFHIKYYLTWLIITLAVLSERFDEVVDAEGIETAAEHVPDS